MTMILAIDPAARTGFAHSSGVHGVWMLGKEPGMRCATLTEKIEDALAKYGADVLAYESATFGSFRSLHVMRRHNELAGVIEGAAAKAGIPCWSFPPTQWKVLAIGKGNAKKPDVMRLLELVYGIVTKDEDVADAIGILKAAERGPPPEPKKKAAKRVEKELLKRQAKLFR